jgi:hypothetical protein
MTQRRLTGECRNQEHHLARGGEPGAVEGVRAVSATRLCRTLPTKYLIPAYSAYLFLVNTLLYVSCMRRN